jgi:hypothetical protein
MLFAEPTVYQKQCVRPPNAKEVTLYAEDRKWLLKERNCFLRHNLHDIVVTRRPIKLRRLFV